MFADGLINLHTRDVGAGIRLHRGPLGLTETLRPPAAGVPGHVGFRAGAFTVARIR
ncbi:hypothetical protein [Actinoplanes siamensis]|uniref:Uncharacterized protein n=1 Tax=Actinoplanes siamensis TaxID=1223317 RepID=A0A919NBW1_9ACTN|nr:hypothetical protein [Actinoplanes siamensis]GIF08329.1 hypothetical protein Asi03nite_58670 [Actinoplanes siamensis]